MNLKRTIRRAARENTIEHAVAQVALTLLSVSVLSASAFWLGALALLMIAILRGLHNV